MGEKNEEEKEEQVIARENMIRPPKFSLDKKKIQISNEKTADKK